MTQELTFEKKFSTLEDLVETLNKGEQPLDVSLKLYEQADQLIQTLSQELTAAEKKVEMLIKNRNGALELDEEGHPKTTPFA